MFKRVRLLDAHPSARSGLDDDLRITVSTAFTARTDTGRTVYDLHGRALRPRPGTPVPAIDHVTWHRREVFKGESLAA